MKLELVHTIEADAEWFKVYVDDTCQKCFKVSDGEYSLELTKREAQSFYDNIKRRKESIGLKEVLLSEEI